jgi:RNA polymerase sigma factor (sigma-70 family)
MSESRSPRASPSAQVLPSHFERFYRHHAESLLVFFARRTLDADLALELTAETFAIAYAKRAKFRGTSPEQAAAWLYAIARNQLNRFHRSGAISRRYLSRLGLEAPDYTDSDLERVEKLADLDGLRHEVGALFDHLPRRQRVAIQLRVVEERSYDEVAARLSISEDTARARVSRGLRTLRSQLSDVPKEMLA